MNNENNKLIWAIYARKSSENEDRQTHSIEDQEKVMRKVAVKDKITIKIVITDAKSAKIRNNRPGFTQLMKMIDKGQINAILTWKTDRLSRNPVESGMIMEALQLGKVKCIKTSDREHHPDDNALIFAVEQGMANQYSRDLAKNVKRGMDSKAEKGWFPGSAPVGYLNLKSEYKGQATIISDPDRFNLVRKMWDLILSRQYSIPEVLRIATNDWSLITHTRKRTGGKPIGISYMYLMFSNIFYTGNFMYNGKFYRGNHEQMITMDEFERTQVILGKKGKPKLQKHEFPFTGMIKCSFCFSSITATIKKKFVNSTNSVNSYTYYHCTRKKKHVKCHESPLTGMELETQIQVFLEENQISDSFYNLALNVLHENESNKKAQYEEIIQSQRRNLNEIQNKLDRLLGFAVNGTISEEQYQNKRQQLELELEKQKCTINDANRIDPIALTKRALDFSYNASKAFEKSDYHTRKSILNAIGSNRFIKDKKLILDKVFWLNEFKKLEKLLYPEIQRLELSKYVDIQSYNEVYHLLFPLMWALLEDVRTRFSEITETIIIPDLSQLEDSVPKDKYDVNDK